MHSLQLNMRRRTRIWRSLRYHDLFFYAMMGRTPITMAQDSYYLAKTPGRIDQFWPEAGQEIALVEAINALVL